MKIRNFLWALIATVLMISGCAGVTETGNPVPQPEVSNWPTQGDTGNPPTTEGPGDVAYGDPTGGQTGQTAPLSHTFYNNRVVAYYPGNWTPQSSDDSNVIFTSGDNFIFITAKPISASETTENYLAANISWISFKAMTRAGYDAYSSTEPDEYDATRNSMRYFLRKGDVIIDITTVYDKTGTPGDGVINSIYIY